MEAEVRIFTLNCWGLGLGISKDRDERMEDIGKYINNNEYDIVFCQVSDRFEDLDNAINFQCFRKCGKRKTFKPFRASSFPNCHIVSILIAESLAQGQPFSAEFPSMTVHFMSLVSMAILTSCCMATGSEGRD